MFHTLVKLLICIIFLGGCSVQTIMFENHKENKVNMSIKQDVPDSFIQQDLSIVTVGDSLTEGIGDETNNGGYTGVLQDQLAKHKEFRSVTLSNFGIKGHKTTDLLKRLENEEVQTGIKNADIVIITIGGNDLMKVVRENFLDISFELFEAEQGYYEQRLQQVLTNIRELNSDAKILLVGLYNPFEVFTELSGEINTVINNWNEASINILSQFENTTFVKVDHLFRESDEELLSSDHFHPNARGYELISDEIIKTILRSNGM